MIAMKRVLTVGLMLAAMGAQAGPAEELMTKGGSGSFGAIPMAPTPATKINDADLKTVVQAILKS